MTYLIIFILIAALAASLRFQWVFYQQKESAYTALADAEQALGPVHEASIRLQELQRDLFTAQTSLNSVSQQAQAAIAVLEPLRVELDFVDAGFYRPVYEFPDSPKYKAEIEALRDAQKEMVKSGTAVRVAEWTVADDEKAGAKFSKDIGLLILRAFNGECDATIAKVSYKNLGASKTRIDKAYAALNKLGTAMQAELSKQYLVLRHRELKLVFEYIELKYEEAEEQRAIRERMREEEKSQLTLQKAIDDAEADERKWRTAIVLAQTKLAKSVGEEKSVLAAKVAALEAQLNEALEDKQRAVSMAQKTRAGYVYVISNLGSFGEDVFKIGMTRRLEPMDRVRELGDASVPFSFDVHALIYSEDAPTLETDLHKELAGYQMNKVNDRKEFFKVDLGRIEQAVNKKHGRFKLTRLAEAKEFRETLALRGNSPAPTESPTDYRQTEFARNSNAKRLR